MLRTYPNNKLALARAVAKNYSRLYGRGTLVWVMRNNLKQVPTQKALGDEVIEVCTHSDIRLNPEALALFCNGKERKTE